MLLRRGLPFALAVAVGAAALTLALSKRVTPEYEATATLLASRPTTNLQGSFGVSLVTAPVVDISAYQAAATSYPVLRDALDRMGAANVTPRDVSTFEELVTVRVENAQQSSLLRVTMRNADALQAADAANAIAGSMLAWDEQRATQNLQTVVETLEAQIASLDGEIAAANEGEPDAGMLEGLRSLRAERALQLNAARALRTSAVGNLEVLEPALPADAPSSPRPTRNAALAFVLGIFLVYGLVLLRDALDTRFRDGDDLARTAELPVLGEFPRLPTGTRRLPREAASYLRTNVQFATATDHPKVVLVTSAGSEQGKTSVAASLAESFARNDYRTLLVDADMRRPRVHMVFGLARQDGASLRDHLERPDAALPPQRVTLDGATLDVIASFEPAPSPTELLSQSFAGTLLRFKPEYDVIVIDTPPILPVADTLTMAPHTTGVLFAVSMPDTDRRSVNAALGLLERIGVRLLGTVMTNVEGSRGGRAEYGYGYGYGYGAETGAPAAAQPQTTLAARAGLRVRRSAGSADVAEDASR